MDQAEFEKWSEEFLMWCNQLRGSGQQCVDDTRQQLKSKGHASIESGRIVERVMDVMGTFDEMMDALGEAPVFKPALDALKRSSDPPDTDPTIN